MNGVHLLTREKKTSQNGSKMGRVHRVHCPRPAQAPSHPASPAPRVSAPAAAHLQRARLLAAPAEFRTRLARLRPRTARCRALLAARPERPAPQPAAAPCAPCPRPCAPRLSYRGPNGRVVGTGCAPARPHRRHSALHAPAA